MKWKTHVAVVRAICCEADLPPHIGEMLVNGSTGPDELRNEFIDIYGVPHHSVDPAYIEELLAVSVRAYEEGREEMSAYLLGSALHLIQDRCVKAGGRRAHDRIEARIARLEIRVNWVRKGLRKGGRSWRRIRRQVAGARGCHSARRSLKRATVLSASLVSSVYHDL